jgi:hypothetical protein
MVFHQYLVLKKPEAATFTEPQLNYLVLFFTDRLKDYACHHEVAARARLYRCSYYCYCSFFFLSFPSFPSLRSHQPDAAVCGSAAVVSLAEWLRAQTHHRVVQRGPRSGVTLALDSVLCIVLCICILFVFFRLFVYLSVCFVCFLS